ncbi:MAG TPA: hypothetical protein VFM53_06290 [Anaeromyxobacteraceae bacterium]|nr:hypothetical protein [Anaeromyxobacteraceae bacterium]
MSGGLLFVSQSLLDAWADQGRIELDGQSIALAAGEGRGRRYALEPAVRFLRVAGGGEDVERLVARVKTLAQIRERGGDAMARSVVLGEVAYEVEPGYLAEASAVEAASRMAPPARGPGGGKANGDGRPLPGDLEDRRQEAEALARFLLDNLS